MNTKINIIIPMAGEGKRFKDAGYTKPKPFIEIRDKPMIQLVIENLSFTQFNMKFVFIVQQKHCDEFGFDNKIRDIVNTVYGSSIAKRVEIIKIDYLTEGAACTVLKARDLINNDTQLLIANSDQVIDWNIQLFIQGIEETDADGSIPVFHNTHPKWSYAELNTDGNVIRVREKEPISTYATIGLYWLKKGSDFVWAADEMIHKNLRVNNEYYVCPIFNELIIPKNKKVISFQIPSYAMHGLGTPEDLNEYIKLIDKRKFLENKICIRII